jgi:hypothetical protein
MQAVTDSVSFWPQIGSSTVASLACPSDLCQVLTAYFFLKLKQDRISYPRLQSGFSIELFAWILLAEH